MNQIESQPIDAEHFIGDPEQLARENARIAWKILGVLFVLSVVLGVVFLRQYLVTMKFVRYSLNEPTQPLAWSTEALSPEECINEGLAWAAECHGIKSLCDMYVDRVLELCMDSQPRGDYCHSLGDLPKTTRFGFEDCQARGVRRHINAEVCGKSYRFMANYCEANFPEIREAY